MSIVEISKENLASGVASEALKRSSFFKTEYQPRAKSPTREMAMKLARWGVAPVRCCGIVEHPDGGFECTHDAYARKKAKQYGKADYDKCQSPGKRPYGAKWQKYLTTDLTILHDEWKGWKGESNVGFATGSLSGLVIIDIDGETGFKSLAALEAMYEPLPKTILSITGSGGHHYIFRIPAGETIHNSASTFGAKALGVDATKIDIRGEGGQAIAPPSRHKSGNHYRFADGCSIDDIAFADVPELPAWAVQLCKDAAAGAAATKPKGSAKASKTGPEAQRDKFAEAGADMSGEAAEGVEHFLSLIGDHEGGAGFDAPIRDAANSYFARNGVDAPSDVIHKMLRDRIAVAERDPNKSRDRYDTDEYLIPRVEGARGHIAESKQREAARVKDEVTRINELVDSFDDWTPEADVMRVHADLAALDAPPAQFNAIVKKLAKKIGTTTNKVEKAVKAEAGIRSHLVRNERHEAERKESNKANLTLEGREHNPVVSVGQDDFNETVALCWSRLTALNTTRQTYFQIGDAMVRLLPPNEEGVITTERLDAEKVWSELNEHVNWIKPPQREGGTPRVVTASTDVAKQLLNQSNLRFPDLEGFVNSPFFTKDGELIATRGYHAGAKVFYSPPADFVLPDIPKHPTIEEVKDSLSKITDDVLVDFPFHDGDKSTTGGRASKAHAIALLLQQFMRKMIPGHLPYSFVQKPDAGTGASLMIQSLMRIALGRDVAAKTETEPNEMRKQLTTFLLTREPVLFIDNLNMHVHGAALANFATCGVWDDRRLGVNENVRARVTCTTILAGNNVAMSKEIARRCAPIGIDAERDPLERTGFKHDLETWVPAHRAELVAACLTLIRYWIDQGRPEWRGKPLPSFEGWSRVMGGLLECIGVAGFLQNLDMTREASSGDEEPWGAFCSLWYDLYGSTPRPIGRYPLFDGKSRSDYDGDKSLLHLIEEHSLNIKLKGEDKLISLGMRMKHQKGVHKHGGRAFRVVGSVGDDGKRGTGNGQLWSVVLVVVDPFMSAAERLLLGMTEEAWEKLAEDSPSVFEEASG